MCTIILSLSVALVTLPLLKLIYLLVVIMTKLFINYVHHIITSSEDEISGIPAKMTA